MQRSKEDSAPNVLSNAAETSVKDAITRGRKKRARAYADSDEIEIAQTTITPSSEKASSFKKEHIPYHKRRKTSLIPNVDDSDSNDSMDEWDEPVTLEKGVVEAVMASLKERQKKTSDAVIISERSGTEGASKDDMKKRDDEKKTLSQAERKAQERMKATEKRKSLLRKHSLHVALLIANLLRLDEAAQNDEVRAFSLSMVPHDTFFEPEEFTTCLSRLGLWLNFHFTRTTAMVHSLNGCIRPSRMRRLCSASERALLLLREGTCDIMDLLTVVAAMIRVQGYRCRIVSPLQLVSHRSPKLSSRVHSVTGRRQVVDHTAVEDTQGVIFGWLEVLSPEEKKWIPFDVFQGAICTGFPEDSIERSMRRIAVFDAKKVGSDCTSKSVGGQANGVERRRRARDMKNDGDVRKLNSALFFHVVAVENGVVSDVTRRYVRRWSHVEKGRAKGKVFVKVVEKIGKRNSELLKDEIYVMEMEEFDGIQADEAVPNTVTALHGHPRYILERHLKKYEAIYPKDEIVGMIKNEAIYLRKNLHVLHTKDRWIRQMRKVRDDEKSVKSVKSKNGSDDIVDLFGEWQTSALIIEACVDGKVPKGEHGNVDIWTSEHLPKGSSHINMKYARSVARRLGIDFAPAMTGFDVRGGRSVPRIEGVVVATENVEIIREAARTAQLKACEREEEKKKEAALQRWLKLFRHIAAREKVQRRYGGGMKPVCKQDGKIEEEGRKVEGSSWHEHCFSDARLVEGSTFVKKCITCGIQVEFEEL